MKNAIITAGSQNHQVLTELFRNGLVTNLSMTRKYEITRLGSVIHELRKKGFPILPNMKEGLNGKKYASYLIDWREEQPKITLKEPKAL